MSDTFLYRGVAYSLYSGLTDERAVELPIAWTEVTRTFRYRSRHILEVGNVLSQYYQVRHDVLDKYEERHPQQVGGKFISEDAAFWKPNRPYDFIISISTMEHVGELTDDGGYKPLAAIYNLLLYGLRPGGRMLFTWPWGYHDGLDEVAREGLLDARVRGLRRTGKREWVECEVRELEGVRYNRPYPKGNGVVVGEMRRKG